MNCKIILFFLLGFFIAKKSVCQIPQEKAPDTIINQLIGTYTDGYTSILRIEYKYDKLFIIPSFKKGIYLIDTSNPNDLMVTEIFSETTKPLPYNYDAHGNILSLYWEGINLFKKKTKNLQLIELLISNDHTSAVEQYLKHRNKLNVDRLFSIGIFILDSLPSQIETAQEIFEIITTLQPKNADGFYHLARTYMSLKKRELAKSAFQRSIQLGSKYKMQISYYLSIINSDVPNLKYPSIDFNKLFSLPRASEIKAIKENWKRNFNPPSEGIIELDTLFNENGFKGRIKVLSYDQDGEIKYGAIFVPENDKLNKFPAIVEAKGIDWQYSGLDLSYRPKLAGYLGEEANSFIYIIPSVRGETMTFLDKIFKSDGLPNNGWVGATEDYLSFFNVAYNYLGDKLDMSRIIAFGDSRGGTVAMLAGIRDKRFNSVINWTGPIDWVNYMDGANGITLKEQVILGLNKGIMPESGTPGQFIDWYFYKGGDINQELIRYKIIASSPLYFLDELPNNFMIHYGKEDLQVPVQNGYRLVDEWIKAKRDTSNFKFFFHENIGHNLNPYEAIIETRKFILKNYFE